MTLDRPFRMLSGSGASWRVRGVVAGTATEGWQDKRAHLARRSGGCFCWVFRPAAHIAGLAHNVRQGTKTLFLIDFLHIAGLRHGR